LTSLLTISGGTVTYTWTNNNTSIGLDASGSGNIDAFTATNAGPGVAVATITVTPHFANGGVTCDGPTKTFTFTVNPTAEVNQPSSQVVCNGGLTTEVDFISINNGGSKTFTWTNDNTSIGLDASGSLSYIVPFTAVNAGLSPVIATITVTPHFTNGNVTCDGPTKTFTITVNPTAEVDQPSSQVVCNGAQTTAVTFSTVETGGTVTYSWTNDTPSIGLNATGTGDIAAFAAVNNGSLPVIANIVVTPHFENGTVTCDGPTKSFTITVNPAAEVNQPSSQVVCNGGLTTLVHFTTDETGGTVTYTWTNDNTSIGLGASGTTDIAAFTAANSGIAPVVATITVTPHFDNGGVICVGQSKSFTITVNPTGEVEQPASQVVCNNASTTAVIFTTTNTGGSVSYSWTNDNITIGLASSGNSDIAAFTATNSTSAPVVATITVTPHFTNDGVTCDGPTKTFTITVNPTGEVDQPSSQVVCNAGTTTEVDFTTTNSGGSVSYTWTNNTISIGLAASGSDNILAFTAANTGSAPVIATIIVTPHFANGSVTCDGPTKTFTITVNPTGEVEQPSSQVVCNAGTTTEVDFTTTNSGGSVNYTWTNNTISIGLAASGSDNILAFTAANTGSAPVIATIIVTPHFTNGGVTCDGPAKSFTITVNPTATVNQISNLTYCNGVATSVITFTSPETGTTYAWANDNINIGLGASGTGNLPVFTTTNSGTAPIFGTITVTPTANGCAGTPMTFTITVNPTATADQVSNLSYCKGVATSEIDFTSPETGTTYEWTNSNTSIGLIASGSGNILSFLTTNTGTAPISGTITVTPTAYGCVGTPMIFTITITPNATVDQISDITYCNAVATSVITFTSPESGTTYAWANDNINIGLGASGIGNLPSFTTANTGTAPISGTITVTPTTNGCVGTPMTFTITVNPVPEVDIPMNQMVCNGVQTDAVHFTTTSTGGTMTYTWTNTNTSIGLAATGTGDIAPFIGVNSGLSPSVGRVTVTPHFTNGGVTCDGPSQYFIIIVNPTPEVDQPISQVVCNSGQTALVHFTTIITGGVTTYSWTNDTPSIGLDASGSGDIAAFTAVNTGLFPVVATITVTPHFDNAGNCNGPAKTFTITVNPTAEVDQPLSQVVCNGAQTTAVNFTTTNTNGTVSYSWTNSTLSIGLAGNGNGNIARLHCRQFRIVTCSCFNRCNPSF
jgi:hypothetical protein